MKTTSICRTAFMACSALMVLSHASFVCAQADAIAVHKKLIVRTWNLCKYEPSLDCQWQGMLAASDGNCYFAASTDSFKHGAVVFRYEPKGSSITRLCDDISRICGEDPRTRVPQGVMPTMPVEIDGWIYWGTHCGDARPEAPALYTGGHVVGYNMRTGEWRDLGIPRKNFTIYSGLAGDAKRKRLYGTVTPLRGSENEASRLYRIDLPDGTMRDAGIVAYGGATGSGGIWTDAAGKCWLSAAGGTLLNYDPAKDLMQGWPGILPSALTSQGFPDPELSVQSDRMWQWVQGAPGQNACIFTQKSSSALYMFRAGLFGRGAGQGFSFFPQIVGSVGLGCAVGGERVYFVQSVVDARVPEAPLLHLRSLEYGRAAARIVDHGAIVDEEGRIPLEISALAADDEGRVFMTGNWRTIKGDTGTLVYGDDAPIDRALFFGVVQVQ